MFVAPLHGNRRAARREWTLGVALALAVLTTTGDAAAQTYYVDKQSPTCSDAGPGTEAQPYCTISAAVAARKGPGITIIVKSGTYREQVTIPASGTAAQPYVIRAQGAGVVVDGSDDYGNPALWAPYAGTVWLAAGVSWNAQQVFVDGARLSPAAVSPELLPTNAFTWVTGQGLYVNLGGDNPGTRQTLVGRRSYGFNLFSKSWVKIEGFEVARTESRGIYLQTGCTDITVAGNRVRFANSYGIQTVGGIGIVIEGNVVSDCHLHGIGLTAGATGCTVRDNESFNNADPNIRRANGIYLHGAPANTLYRNRVHHNQDTGMQFSSGANDCIAYNNRSWANGDHGYDHLNAPRTIHVHDVAYGNYKDGFSIEGDSPGSQLYNCIGVDNGLTTDEFNLWVNDLSAVGFVSNYNLFWNSTSQPPIKYIATKYALLTDYQAASGQDANSMQVDPRFVNAAAGDFRLRSGSPAIDAAHSGVPNWPATDAVGSGRLDDPSTANRGGGPVPYADLGALEYLPETDLPPVVTAPGNIQTAPGSTVSFTVTATDPNGQPIQSLVMVPIKMPRNHGAVFTPNADNTAGTFTWTVASGLKGTFTVEFRASNSLTGTARTNIQVKGKGRLAKWLGAEEAGELEGGVIALSNGVPNPSRGGVEFALDLPQTASVRWAVFDLQGRAVWSEERVLGAGRSVLRWDGTTGRGPAAAGVYLMRAWVDDTQFTRRVVRL